MISSNAMRWKIGAFFLTGASLVPLIMISGCGKDEETGATTAQVASFSNKYSLHLDGSNGKAVTAASGAADILGATFEKATVGFWFKWEGSTYANGDAWFHLNPAGGISNTFHFFVNPTGGFKPIVYVRGTVGTTGDYGNTVLSDYDSAWHHLLATYDGTLAGATVKFYIDGVLQTNDTDINSTGVITTGSSVVQIGQGATSNYTAFGWIDEVAIWSSVLSAAEVTAIYNEGKPTDLKKDAGDYASAANLKAWWRMGDSDGGTGTTVTDDASGVNLTLDGNAQLQADQVP